MKQDALGRPLEVGQLYGYSRVDNGITTVKTGKLLKINSSLVTLEVEDSKWAVYSNQLEDRRFQKKTVSVKANGMFPIYEFNLGDSATCEDGYNHGEVFKVTGIRADEIELSGDWSGGTHAVYQSQWVKKEQCKLVRNGR